MIHANPINLVAIDHVVFRVLNLDKMIAFYCEVLGCKLERGPGKYKLAQLRAGNALIDLVDANGPLGRQAGDVPDRNAPNVDHVCLQVQPWDADAIVAHLHKHGIDSGDIETRYGAMGFGPSVYIADPEGNTVELKGAA